MLITCKSEGAIFSSINYPFPDFGKKMKKKKMKKPNLEFLKEMHPQLRSVTCFSPYKNKTTSKSQSHLTASSVHCILFHLTVASNDPSTLQIHLHVRFYQTLLFCPTNHSQEENRIWKFMSQKLCLDALLAVSLSFEHFDIISKVVADQ